MKKWVPGMLLCLMAAVLLSTAALADGPDKEVALVIDGTSYPYDEPAAGQGWQYNGDYRLTLNDFSGNGIVVKNPKQDFCVVLPEGTENSLSYLWTYCSDYSMILDGAGSLHVSGQIGMDCLLEVYDGQITVEGELITGGFQLVGSEVTAGTIWVQEGEWGQLPKVSSIVDGSLTAQGGNGSDPVNICCAFDC